MQLLVNHVLMFQELKLLIKCCTIKSAEMNKFKNGQNLLKLWHNNYIHFTISNYLWKFWVIIEEFLEISTSFLVQNSKNMQNLKKKISMFKISITCVQLLIIEMVVYKDRSIFTILNFVLKKKKKKQHFCKINIHFIATLKI